MTCTYRFTCNTISLDTFRLDLVYVRIVGYRTTRWNVLWCTRPVIVVILLFATTTETIPLLHKIYTCLLFLFFSFPVVETRNKYFSVSLPVAITTANNVPFFSYPIQHHNTLSEVAVGFVSQWLSSEDLTKHPCYLRRTFRFHVSFSLRKSTSFFFVVSLERYRKHRGRVSEMDVHTSLIDSRCDSPVRHFHKSTV